MHSLFFPVLELCSSSRSPATITHAHSPKNELTTIAQLFNEYSQSVNSLVIDQRYQAETTEMFEKYQDALIKIDEKIEQYREKLRKNKLDLQVYKLTSEQRSYLKNCLDDRSNLLECARILDLPAIEIEKFLRANEDKINEHQVFFLRSNLSFRQWLASLFKKEAIAPHLNNAIKDFLSVNDEEYTSLFGDCAQVFEQKIQHCNDKIRKKNEEISLLINKIRHRVEESTAKTLANLGRSFQRFDEKLNDLKTALGEDLSTKAKEELDRIYEFEELIEANRKYVERISSLDEDDGLEEASEDDEFEKTGDGWGQFSRLHSDSSLMVYNFYRGEMTIGPIVSEHLLRSQEGSTVHVKQIDESPRGIRMLGR